MVKQIFSCSSQLSRFINFIKDDKKRKTKFFLTVFFFLLIPTGNAYVYLKIPPGKPVVRQSEVALPDTALYPLNLTGQPVPFLTARAVLVIDAPSKAVIYQKNEDYQLPPASTTKIMTALVALDHWRLDDVLEVKTVYNIGQTMELEQGEKITVENLLYGLLVQSGNDAAYTLANNYPGGLTGFVEEMNNKARELYLSETFFTNPIGIDNGNHLTTVHDLALLASQAMENKVFAQIVATAEITVVDASGQINHQLENINQLVGEVEGLKGVKTGWTSNAGECLVTYIEREKGRIITVILGSQDRFGETRQLIDWVYSNFDWQAIESNQQ